MKNSRKEQEYMRVTLDLREILISGGIYHHVIVRDNEVVITKVDEINENIISNENGLFLEMSNGVMVKMDEKVVAKYLRESIQDSVDDKIQNVIEGRYPEQYVSRDEITTFKTNDEMMNRFIRATLGKIIIETDARQEIV